MRNLSLFVIVLLAIGAQGCGLRGPLYLPEPAKEVSAPPDESEKDKKKSEQPAPAQALPNQQR